MKRLVMCFSVNRHTGYGSHGIEIAKYFLANGREVAIRPVSYNCLFNTSVPDWVSKRFVWDHQPESWELLLHPPNAVPSPGKKTAYFSMWETTKLAEKQIDAMNAASIVICPCKWNMECFKECGIRPQIELCHLGFSPLSTYSDMAMDGNTVFGAAGRLVHGESRKGVNRVINIFNRAFPKEQDVRLKVKGFSDCEIRIPKDERVEVIQRFMEPEEVSEWIKSLTCFVSAAKGEGFGLWQLESMACGRPVVASIYGGLSEFMNHENSYSCKYRTILADQKYIGLGEWCDPDDNHFIELMRSVYRDRKTAQSKGILASQQVASMTWDNSCRRLESILKSVGAL